MMNESIDVNPNELLAMLAGDEGETEEEAEEENEEEARDIVTDLDGQFAGAIDGHELKSELNMKRKRESEGECECANMFCLASERQRPSSNA